MSVATRQDAAAKPESASRRGRGIKYLRGSPAHARQPRRSLSTAHQTRPMALAGALDEVLGVSQLILDLPQACCLLWVTLPLCSSRTGAKSGAARGVQRPAPSR